MFLATLTCGFRRFGRLNKTLVSKRHITQIVAQSKVLTKKMPHRIFGSGDTAKESFRFTDYDCLGFDLDNTICRYKIGAMVKLEYEAMAKYLVEVKCYPSTHLYKPIEDNLDFMVKGLILDAENGNLLRVGPDGEILHGSHGTVELTRQELMRYYGEDCRWHVTDLFSKDPLHTWNGPESEKMRTLLDYFDMPAGLVFARAVDTIDEVKKGRQAKYQVWPDLLEGLQHMFSRENFQLSKGGYFPQMKSTPEEYYHKCSTELINWFKALREKGKILFLITGSNFDFASHTAENSMGPSWRELFDITCYFAKKPGFFTQDRPFIGIDGLEETGPVQVDDLERGGEYINGNWTGLYEFLKKHSKKQEPKVLYIGDNLIQDVYTPAKHTCCDTVAVVEELEAEGAYGHIQDHTDQPFLVSSTWGSYFCHNDESRLTIWKDMISKHAKLCIPSLEFVAKKPIDFDYYAAEN